MPDHDRHLDVIVTADPESAMEVGDAFKYEAVRFPIKDDVPGSPVPVSNWGLFRGSVLAVGFPGHGTDTLIGSAILVAPGVAIGATHVFDEARPSVVSERAGAVCMGLDSNRAHMWNVRHISTASESRSDVAIYSLELASAVPEDRTFIQPVVSTRTPAMGERLTIFGFRESSSDLSRADAMRVRIDVVLLVCAGVVTQQHPERRDTFGLPCPCVELDCATLGGMSGGPAFDEDGRLVGVLSRGFNGATPSWVSLLWPALGWKMKGGWPAGLTPSASRLFDNPLCAIDRREALVYSDDGNQVQYLPWT